MTKYVEQFTGRICNGTKARTRGIALLTALLVTSIATVTAVSISSRQFIDVRRTSNMMESDQAYMYAIGLETVAKQLLSKYVAQYKYDDPQLLFQPYTFPVEGGVVSGKLVDLEAVFNLNSLIGVNGKKDQLRYEQFERLLGFVMQRLNETPANKTELANAVLDWIDADGDVSFPGAEDTDYQILELPYRTANRLMGSASELFLIKGFTKELLNGKKIDDKFEPGLLKYVTALPQTVTSLDINTMDPLVLKSLSKHFDDKIVQDIISDRPYKTLNDFTQGPVIKTLNDALNKQSGGTNQTGGNNQSSGSNQPSSANQTGGTNPPGGSNQVNIGAVDVQSSYHMVDSSVSVGSTSITLSSMLYHDTGGRNVVTVSRAQGTSGL